MKLQTVFLPFFLPFLSIPAHANRALMESTTATAFTIFVDTGNTQVDVGTNTYGGGLTNVKLYVSSNLVVGPDNGCVVFSTGSIACKGNTILGNCLAYSTGSLACTGNLGAGNFNSYGNATIGNCIAYSTGSIACTGAISGPWTRSGTNVILTNIGDNIGIGSATPDILGNGSSKIIGIRSGTAANSVAEIQLVGDQTTASNVTGALWFGQANGGFNASVMRGFRDGADNSQAIQWLTPSVGVLAERMRLTSAGNLAIGVSAPTDNDGFGGTILDNNGPIYARKAGSSNFAVMAMFGGETSIDAGGTGNILKLFTNGSEGMRIAANRHVEFTGTAPTVGTCGTAPSVVGNDNAGIITVGGGAVTACTLTFASAWTNTAVCTVSDDSASISAAVTTANTTSIIIGLSASGSTKIYYVCRGYR